MGPQRGFCLLGSLTKTRESREPSTFQSLRTEIRRRLPEPEFTQFPRFFRGGDAVLQNKCASDRCWPLPGQAVTLEGSRQECSSPKWTQTETRTAKSLFQREKSIFQSPSQGFWCVCVCVFLPPSYLSMWAPAMWNELRLTPGKSS